MGVEGSSGQSFNLRVVARSASIEDNNDAEAAGLNEIAECKAECGAGS